MALARNDKEPPANSWIFLGIGLINKGDALSNNANIQQQTENFEKTALTTPNFWYERALSVIDEGIEKSEDKYHPSLLRRRAMVLESLGREREAYWAYHLAKLELRYRLTNELHQNTRYAFWYSQIK